MNEWTSPTLKLEEIDQRISESKPVSRNDLYTLSTCLKDRYKLIWQLAGAILVKTSKYSDDSCEELKRLSNDKSSDIRWRIPVSFNIHPPTEKLAHEVLCKLLEDRSKKVREISVEAARRMLLKSILPHMRERLLGEKNHELQESINFAINEISNSNG